MFSAVACADPLDSPLVPAALPLDHLTTGSTHPLAVADRLVAALEEMALGEPIALIIPSASGDTRFGAHETRDAVMALEFSVGARNGRVVTSPRGAQALRSHDVPLAAWLSAYWLGVSGGVALDLAYHAVRTRGRDLAEAVRRITPLRTITQLDDHLADAMAESFDLTWAAWYRPEHDEYHLRSQAGADRGDVHGTLRTMLIDPTVPPGHPPLLLHSEPDLGLLLPSNTRVVVAMDDGATRAGLLLLGDRKSGVPWCDDDLDAVRTLSALISTIAGHALQIEDLGQSATTDPLTSLFNRRHYTRMFEQELGRHLRRQEALSLLMLDLDHFKKVNDNYGHEAGDKVLVAVAKIIQSELRIPDVACRLGGEEFAVILPHTDLPGAVHVAERIRTAIARDPIVITDQLAITITASLGVASCPRHGRKREPLEAGADAALYQAKQHGRDQTRTATDPAASATDPGAPAHR